jgi:hypothetical protein
MAYELDQFNWHLDTFKAEVCLPGEMVEPSATLPVYRC